MLLHRTEDADSLENNFPRFKEILKICLAIITIDSVELLVHYLQ